MNRARVPGLLLALFTTLLCASAVAGEVAVLCSDLHPLVVVVMALAMGVLLWHFTANSIRVWRAWKAGEL